MWKKDKIIYQIYLKVNKIKLFQLFKKNYNKKNKSQEEITWRNHFKYKGYFSHPIKLIFYVNFQVCFIFSYIFGYSYLWYWYDYYSVAKSNKINILLVFAKQEKKNIIQHYTVAYVIWIKIKP